MTMAGSMPTILIINLDRAEGRLALQRQQFARLGMEFERVRAVDGAALPAAEVTRYAYRWERPISATEVGCLLSHRLCWQKVAAGGRSMMIMEDDVILAPEIKDFLSEAGRIEGPTTVNLETQNVRKFLSVEPVRVLDVGGLAFFELMLGTPGAGAYLVTPEAARILSDNVEGKAAIADVYLHSLPGIRRFQVDPGLAAGVDVLGRQFGLPVSGDTSTTITRPTLNHAYSVAELFRHPRLRARRIAGQVRLALRKLRLSGRAVRRVVAPSPSIHASYEAMKGVRNG